MCFRFSPLSSSSLSSSSLVLPILFFAFSLFIGWLGRFRAFAIIIIAHRPGHSRVLFRIASVFGRQYIYLFGVRYAKPIRRCTAIRQHTLHKSKGEPTTEREVEKRKKRTVCSQLFSIFRVVCCALLSSGILWVQRECFSFYLLLPFLRLINFNFFVVLLCWDRCVHFFFSSDSLSLSSFLSLL